MKITIESTDRIILIEQGGVSIPARMWEGKTDSGIEIFCLITRIAAGDGQDIFQFAKELQEQKPPSLDAVRVWPSRMIL